MTESAFDVAWAPSAPGDLARLPYKVATAVIELAYKTLAEAPHRVGGELHFDLERHRSARRGDFRVVCRIDDDDERGSGSSPLAHRGDVYRRR